MTRYAAPTRRRLFLLLPLVVLTVALWAWLAPANDVAQQVDKAQWLPVAQQPVEQRLGLVGRLQAARQHTLSAPFEGVVQELLAGEGQAVEAGQVLARMDPGQIEIQLRQAQAELLKAQRDVHQLRHWSSGAEVARARRTVQTARSTLDATQANLRDTQALFERGIVARMEVDSLVQQVRSQQQDLLAAQDELRSTERRGQDEELTIAEMTLTNAQARHDALAGQHQRQVLKAPFAGVVVRPTTPESGKAVFIQPGVQVTQGTALLTVIGRDQLQVLTRVEESDLHQLREGMSVEITGDGFAGQLLTGRIATIAVQGNAADAPGAAAHYDLVIAVDTPDAAAAQQVRLGMSARLAVILYRNQQGIVVPPQALRSDDAGATYVVYRATPDAAPSQTQVHPGRATLQGIEVQGLQPGYVLMPAP